MFIGDFVLDVAGGRKEDKDVGNMVHLTRVDGEVVLENIEEQTLGRKNNAKDEEKKPKDPEEICRDALGMVGREGYNVLNYNCEHFANECRYGEAESEQITNVKEVVNEASTHIGGVAGLVIGVASEFLTKPENRLPSSILFSDIVEKTDGEAFDDSDFKELMTAMKSLGEKLDKRVDLRSLKFKEEINVRILMIMRYSAILMSDPSQYMLSKKSFLHRGS